MVDEPSESVAMKDAEDVENAVVVVVVVNVNRGHDADFHEFRK